MPQLRTLPPPNPRIEDNKGWYANPDAETTIVFVHGIHSDSRGCWLREPSKPEETAAYWPEIVSADPTFQGVGVFLGGYFTGVDSGKYGLADCADELLRSLTDTKSPARAPVLKIAKRLLFIGHSTGGIVIRRMLVDYDKRFADKAVGVVLMASPSTGSYYADVLEVIINWYKSDLAKVLRTSDSLRDDLDRRFGKAVRQPKECIPQLFGREACEHHHIVHPPPLLSFLTPERRIVDRNSAGRYWLPAEMLPGTDHFTIVKPPSQESESHAFLRIAYRTFHDEYGGVAVRTGPAMIVPPEPGFPLVARQAALAALVTQLRTAQAVAVLGDADIGKTTLLTKAVHEPSVRETFPDGILWGDLSRKSLELVLLEWGSALGLPESTLLASGDVFRRASTVAAEIASRRILLVLDGCSLQRDVHLLRAIGSNTTCVIATRSPELAQEFAPSNILKVAPFDDTEIRALQEEATSLVVRENAAVFARLCAVRNSVSKLLATARLLGSMTDEEARLWFPAGAAL